MQPMPPEQIQRQQRGEGREEPEEESGDGREGALTDMIVQTDQALTGISQVIAKSSPEVGQALAQLNEQYRSIISAFMNQASGEKGPNRAASPMVGPETQGKPAMQAY